jgi:hypothetical protein
MWARVGRCVGILPVAVLTLSCTRVPRFVPENEGGVALEALTERGTVPSGWGNLVTVTTSATTERGTPQLQLWFQDKDGNIREAAFDPQTNQFLRNARLFRRK